MADLRDLYQEVILEHSKAPRNYREVKGADKKAEGFNPLCGDRFTVYLQMNGDSIQDVGFQGSGCAISKASASMMTQSIKGKTSEDESQLGKLTVFAGVSEFPMRVKCATLAWHTLQAALEGKQEAVSTE